MDGFDEPSVCKLWFVRFLAFDEQPIAAASIAQVHHGVLNNKQEVAIKVRIKYDVYLLIHI